jgi:flavin-dependent dehydrogenase
MKTDKIVIVGGGSAGWMTATTLIKEFPLKQIVVIESKDVPTVGVGESTIGGIRKWAQFIGLKEESFFKETDATIKMSIKFTDFYKENSGSFHYPFGEPIVDSNRNPFFDWNLKKYLNKETPTEDFVNCLFPASALFNNNKYSENQYGEFDNFDPNNDIAYHFDATKFAIWLRDTYCKPAGVKHIVSTVVSVNKNEEGIKNLVLENGDLIESDLFIDCTGFKSLLLSESLLEPFISYSEMLPNNRAWATRLPYIDDELEMEGYTNCTAIENGWCWNIPLFSRLGAGYVYSDKFVTPEEAKEEFKQYLMSNKMVVPRTKEDIDNLEFKDIKMRVGIHERTFVKNVVAIGLSAGFIEPLESNGLFSVHEFLFKLIDILQRGEISQFDRDMYNVSVKDLFDNFTKFVVLHYALSHRNESLYWKDINNNSFSDRNGDPYTQYYGRADAFYNLIWRYMENHGHPIGNAGITYIATGMNLNMVNDYRFKDIKRLNPKVLEDFKKVEYLWEERKAKWLIAANNSKTMKQYLLDRYYQ